MSEEKDLLILDKNTIQKQKQLRYKELEDRGIPEPERSRAVEAEFTDYPNPKYAIPWGVPITGVDLAGNINLDLIPASSEPPIIQPNTPYTQPFPTPNKNPYPNNPTPDTNSIGIKSNTYDVTNFPAEDSANWVATGNEINSEPPSVGVEGFNFHKSIPEWRYPIEQSQMVDISIPPIIIEPSGQFNETIPEDRNTIKETIGKIRHQMQWLSEDYLTKAKETAINNNGVLYLIRAASETITDHRSEGEEYRRKLAGKELNAMARTAVGRNMDINHNPDYATGGIIPDSEYGPIRKEIQMLVIETDPQINQYIASGDVTAVSINGGNPRTQSIEPCYEGCIGDTCELCNVPQGVILGELDQIGMTWVVTAPQGIMWRGIHIEPAIPGIKNTVIEIL